MSNPPPVSTLVGIRAAHHPEATPRYDRVVFDFDGPVPLIRIEYVEQLLGAGSGLPVPIAGNAIVSLTMQPAQAHNEQGGSTAPNQVTFNLPNLKQVVGAGDFEAVVTYGIGLDHTAELRVLTLSNRSRVVVDLLER